MQRDWEAVILSVCGLRSDASGYTRAIVAFVAESAPR